MFLKFLLQSEMQNVSDIKRVENYPDFDKLAHVIQHGLQGFIVKNIEIESTGADDISLIL